MEDSIFASLLLVAGLLRVAVASKSEPWSGDSDDQSFLEEGLVTVKSHLVSLREDHADEVTLQLESLTSGPANKGIPRLHGLQRTEAQSASDNGGLVLTTVTGEIESAEPSFTDGALLGHQTDGLVTSRPLINTGVSASKSTSVQQKRLTTLLSSEERMGNVTAPKFSLNEGLSTLTPDKAERLDLFATTLFDAESLESNGQRVTLPTIPNLGIATTGPIHAYALSKRTEPERHYIETMSTPGKELVTAIPEGSQQTQVTGQQTKLDGRTFDATRSPGTLTVAQNASDKSSSAHIFQEMLFQKNGATVPRTEMELHYTSSASSPSGEMTGHETTMAEKPTLLTPAQSNTRPFSPFTTAETLSAASLHQSSKTKYVISQSFQPRLLFPSQPPIFRKSNKRGELLLEGVNSNLHHAADRQTTTQTSLFKASQTAKRESLPLANLQESITEDLRTASLLPHSVSQPPSIPPSVYGKTQASKTSTFSLAHSTSSYSRTYARLSRLGPSFHVSPASPDTSVPARHSIQGVSESQQPYTLSAVHGKQTSPNAFVPSLMGSEPLPTSSAPVLLKPQVLGGHVAPERPDLLLPSQTEPEHESDPSEMAVALTKTTTPGNFASPHAGLNTSAVAQSASSSPRPPTLPKGEQIELNTLVPSQVNGRTLSNAVTFRTISTSSHVELDVPGTTSVAGLENPSPSFLDHTKTKLLPSVSVSFYAKAIPLHGHVHTNSQPPNTEPTHREQQLSTLGMEANAKTQVSGSSTSFKDESHLLVPSTLAQAMTEANRTIVKGGIDAEPLTTGTLPLTTSRAQSLASSSTTVMEHILSDSSANPGVSPLTRNETRTPNTPSSPLLHLPSFNIVLLGSPKLQTSSTFAFVHTEPQLLNESTSAAAAAQTPNLFTGTAISSSLQPQTTPILSVTPRIAEGKSDGKTSSQTSPPTSQAGIYRTSLPGVSTTVSLGKSTPTSAGTASPPSHLSTVNFSLLSSARMEEDAPLGTRTTLAASVAQGLPQRFLGLSQHLNRSGDFSASSLDSLVVNGVLGTSPSLQYLSLLVRNAENMVCLQTMQNTTPVSEELSSDGHGVASAQEALPLSAAFGLPHLGASSLIQMSPSSVILVKPVFVFLPAETPKVPPSPSMEKEWNQETGLTFTHGAVLGLAPYASNQEQQLETSPTMSTIQRLIRTKSLYSQAFSLAKQTISEPVPSAVPKSTETRADSLIANPFPQQLREASTRAKHLGNGIQSSTLDSSKVEGNYPVSLSVVTAADHHHISDASTAMVPILERPSTELVSMPPKTFPFPSLVEPSQMLRSSHERSSAADSPQLSMMLMLHTEDHPHGSVTPITPVSKNPEASLNASSAGNTKLPLEVGHLTPTRLTSHSSLSTELLGKELLLTPSEVQYVPNEMSSSPSPPNKKEKKVSLSSNDSYSKAVVAYSSYPTTTFFSKLFTFHPISPMPPMPSKNPRTLPSPSAIVLADLPSPTTLSGEPVEDLMNHQVPSGLSANMSSQMSVHSSFAKSAMKYDPTIHQRTSLSNTGGEIEPRMSTGETNLSARDDNAHRQMEAIHIVPAVSGTDPGRSSVWMVPTDFRPTSVSPDNTEGSAGLQSLFQKLPLHALQDATVFPVSGGASVMETSRQGLKTVLQPTVSGTNKEGFSSPSPRQDQHPKHRRGGTVRTADGFLVRASPHLEQASLEGEGSVLLDDKWTKDADLSTPSPVFSTILSAPELSTLSSGIEGFDDRNLRQRSHFDSLPLHISESFPHRQTQAQPTPGTFEVTYNIQTGGGFLADAVSSADAISELSSYTSGEQVAFTRDPTGEGNDGEREEDDEEGDDRSVADLPPWDSDSSWLDWRAQHRRRLMRSDDVFLDGLAVVSDDACSSGNYTTEMRLQPGGRGKTPSSPDSFLARIVLRDNGSRPTLSVKSCCVTPTARPTRLKDASCCLFPRSLVECRHIQIHQNSKSGVANFTIQLFQMVNHSAAYLHCELSVCLSQMAGCEQKCLKNIEAPSQPSERNGYQTLHNVISFGPVLKTDAEFTPGLAAGSPLTMTLLSFLVSLAGSVGLMATIVVFWLRRRRQTKMAAHLAPPGTESP